MALSKVNYVDNQTIITAQNLNDIQNEIIQNTELIKNIAPRNLLDNSDFRDPVNQLGIISGTEVESYASFINRWRNGEESSITLSSNGIQPNGVIFQVLDLSAYISKKMTLAVGFSDGSVVIASGTLTEASTEWEFQLIFGTMELGIATQGGIWMVGINYPNSIIQWAALYEGEYTTETLPEYQPKGYENELLVCRQYDPITDEYIGLRKFGQPRNLLDNSDFRNPVNQRGQTTYSGAMYTIDRWRTWEDTAKVTVNDGYITHSGALYQYLARLDKNKTYTFAFKDTNGKIHVMSGKPVENKSDFTGMNIFYDENIGVAVRFWESASYNNIVWAALYEGEYTVDTLPEYQPKGYAAELRECQRYYYKHKASTALFAGCLFNTGVVRVGYILPVPMIKTPSVDVSSTNFGNIDMYAISKVTTHPTSISVNMFSKNSTFLSLALNWSFSATSATAANVRFNTEFSLIADL